MVIIVYVKLLELMNATLAISILLIMLVLIKDFRKQLQSKDNKLKIPLILIGTGIIIFSIREFIKYGITGGKDTVLDELLETAYLLLTLGAFFSLLMIKDLPSQKVK